MYETTFIAGRSSCLYGSSLAGASPYRAMPVRTMSKWARASRRVAALFAVWHSRPGYCRLSSPARLVKRPSCCSKKLASSSSAVAKWLIRPERTPPACACSQNRTTSGAGTPSRPMPVSNLTWTRAPRRAASAMNGSDHPTTSAAEAAARSRPVPVSGPKMRIGAVKPDARNSSASSAVATPSQVEPASSAARATGAAPWP